MHLANVSFTEKLLKLTERSCGLVLYSDFL